MSRSQRVLRVSFDSPEAFEREYVSNLSNAGVFVATVEPFELRENVEVDVVLEFADQSVSLSGEVVHVVGPEMTPAGGTPGVAVQFEEAAHGVREALAPLIAASGSFQPNPADSGRRSAPRIPARVPAVIQVGHDTYEARTRNISRSGVLVSVSGADIPPGASVGLTLIHPTNARSMAVESEVVRQVEIDGEVTALGIQFESEAETSEEFQRFIEAIQSAEHSRRLGGISGSIAELGPQNLLHMFGTTAQAGTLQLVQGDLEGVIGFERGLLCYARAGTASGMKALTRLLAWREGGFEFHARLAPVESPEPPLPLEAAVFEAVRQLDELTRIDVSRFDPEERLRVVRPDAMPEAESSKVEAAVFDLARAGFNVYRIVEVIPEPDPEIYRAIETLIDRGVVAFQEPSA